MYKNETEATREFAIKKFAKDMLDAQYSVQMGYDFAKKFKVEDIMDIEEVRRNYEEIKKGTNMT